MVMTCKNWLTKFLKIYWLVQMSWYEPAPTPLGRIC